MPWGKIVHALTILSPFPVGLFLWNNFTLCFLPWQAFDLLLFEWTKCDAPTHPFFFFFFLDHQIKWMTTGELQCMNWYPSWKFDVYTKEGTVSPKSTIPYEERVKMLSYVMGVSALLVSSVPFMNLVFPSFAYTCQNALVLFKKQNK